MKPKLELSFRKMDMETDHNHAEVARLCLASDPTACCWRSTALLISAQCCPRNGRPKDQNVPGVPAALAPNGRQPFSPLSVLDSCLAPDDKLHPLRRDLQIGSFFLDLDLNFLFPSAQATHAVVANFTPSHCKNGGHLQGMPLEDTPPPSKGKTTKLPSGAPPDWQTHPIPSRAVVT